MFVFGWLVGWFVDCLFGGWLVDGIVSETSVAAWSFLVLFVCLFVCSVFFYLFVVFLCLLV